MNKDEMFTNGVKEISIRYRLIFIGVNWLLAVGSLLMNYCGYTLTSSLLGILLFAICLPFGLGRWAVETFETCGKSDLVVPALLLSLLFHVILIAGMLIPRRRAILIVFAILFLAALALDFRGCEMQKGYRLW